MRYPVTKHTEGLIHLSLTHVELQITSTRNKIVFFFFVVSTNRPKDSLGEPRLYIAHQKKKKREVGKCQHLTVASAGEGKYQQKGKEVGTDNNVFFLCRAYSSLTNVLQERNKDCLEKKKKKKEKCTLLIISVEVLEDFFFENPPKKTSPKTDGFLVYFV